MNTFNHDAEIAKLLAETAKIQAEIHEVNASTKKLINESEKLNSESKKLNSESKWYPIVVASGLMAAGATAATLFIKLFH
ncbi:hypothetical protein FG476_03845 [Xylella fastidiosa subsp. multiplex]|uniref:Uncharacterized protein n=1 Tax=Xylella fastidiosa subsp. multiplex TaxID=644357 RepID=A0A9Q4MII5_XYLFS|nr:hypothetical protein [Xylella fastidiosa]MBE0269555.1 hypothetical protein [Xylella fastidiosa subsp. multiplex]MBE0276530.1 hypothetical protein [Xylella fastidiosa subsp. multiplex]MBE0278726.1 hypothetical protein [Xylella fastidiosa subsp. multiplex]MBE0283102.1 hypothetical protein [Xylella fastidiosa subsp. multiplex]MRT52437.1 hypothetical protein [Xylella fastidiosa subsp. multiplex]